MKNLTKFALTTCAFAVISTINSANAAEITLTAAHTLSESHATHLAIQEMADLIAKNSNGRIEVQIFPNAQMGSASETIEMCIDGDISIVNCGSPSLGTYEEGYHTFGLPYLFKNKEEYYKVMDSKAMQDFFLSTADKGFVNLTYFTSGQRSFYTPNKPIKTPEDLKGLKIRVQNMKSQIDMMKALGATPVAMAYGEVYTSLQTGVIDGTENNELALTEANHGEICKYFSEDQHAMIPDALIMSASVYNELSPEDQKIIVDAAREACQHHKIAWNKATEISMAKAQKEMGVTFVTDIDKTPFIKATEGLVKEYSDQYPGVKSMLELIEKAKAE